MADTTDIDPVRTGRLHRLRFTPMRDLLRLRLTGRLNWRGMILSAALPEPIRELILRTTKRTRLWRSERVDVAAELIAHFRDGLDAGESPEDLVRDFGDTKQAAMLIRRGKIRNRSMLWHTKRFLLRTAGVLFLVYIGLAIYFSIGTPKVSVNYIARLNEPILKLPQDQRAWPFYRQLAAAFEADETLKDRDFELSPTASDKRWPRAAAWVKAHPHLLELTDQATARPAMGFVYGADGSIRELEQVKGAGSFPSVNKDDPFYNSVIGVLLPQLNHLRQTANLLACDARLAAEEGDASRWFRRITQLQVVADQSNEPGFVICGLVRIGIESLRLSCIESMLQSYPSLLSEEQLVELAHRNARHATAADLITFRMERLGFEDVVQRIYTDDGNGDGRIAARGLSNMQAVTNGNNAYMVNSNASVSEQMAKVAVAPVAAIMLASRKDLMQRYNQVMDRAEARLHEPWREHARQPLFIEAQNIRSSVIEGWRYILISVMVPAIDRAGVTAERVIVAQDAINIGIALELYQRKTGHYPPTLADLSPAYQPHVPVDPCDGQPMRYKLVDGKPLVYSIGTDLDDDGGIEPFVKPNVSLKPAPNSHSLAIGRADERYDGDWILYPTPKTPDEVSEEESGDVASTQPATQPAAE